MTSIARTALSLFLVLAASGEASAASVTSLTIPGVANLAGANGTRFESDLVLTNLSDAAADVTVSLIPAAGASTAVAPHQVRIAPRASVSYTNVLALLWSLDGAGGALRVESDATVAANARTYNVTPQGSFGLSLPAISDEQMLVAGDLATAPWVAHSAVASAGFRTNVAVVFPDSEGGRATIVVLGARGEELGRRTFDSSVASFQQDSVASFAAASDVARMAVIVERGRAQAYAAVVDNVTGDSSLFLAERSSNGATDHVISGVGRVAGANGTFFRTDVRLVNLAGSSVSVVAHYWPQGGDNASPDTTTLMLLPLETREITDVLATLFAAPEGSAGAVRFTSSATVRVAARTSNVDRGGAEGTFGSQQAATPLAAFSRSSSILPAIAHDVLSRTNIGFTTAHEATRLQLTLRAAGGDAIAARELALNAYSWTQASAATLFGVQGIEPGATIDVTPLAGAYVAYASLVDQFSGDAAVSPAAVAGCQQWLSLSLSVPQRVCSGQPFSLVAPLNAESYDWKVTGGTIVSGAGTNSITVLPASTSAIALSLTTFANGCVARIDRTINVDAAPVISNARAAASVVGATVKIQWSLSADPVSLQISGSDFSQSVALHPTARSYEYIANSAGTKSFTITATNSCGSERATGSYSVTAAGSTGSSGTGGAYPGLQTFPGARGREYFVYVPASYTPAVPAALVMALGGQGQPASSTLSVGWQQIADRENVLVMTMTASSSGANYSGAYDVAEFETIALAEQEIPRRYNVAVDQIYYWGFSAGGHVTYMLALAAERSNRVAAFAVHAAAIEAAATRVNPPSWPPQAGARRLPVFISCGTLDTSGSGGGLIGALRRNRDMLAAEGYPVQTREVLGQRHTYNVVDVQQAWGFLKQQRLR